MKKKPAIQTLNYNLKDQSQGLVKQQEPRIQKRQIYSCQGLGNTEFPYKLKKYEKTHQFNTIQLYSLIEKLNTEIQILKAENQNNRLLLQIKKRKIKVRQVKFNLKLKNQLPNFYQQKKTQQQIHRKLMKEIELQINKTNLRQIRWKLNKKCKQNKIFTSSPQQNVAIVVKRLDIYESNVRSEKECLSSTEKNLEHQGSYIETALEAFKERNRHQQTQVLLKQDLSSNKINNFKRTTMTLEFIQRSWRKIERRWKSNSISLQKRKKNYLSLKIDSDEDRYS